MKVRKATAYALILLLSVFALAGCKGDDIRRVKENANIVKEYNDSIGTYNKLALSFTSLARMADDEIKKENGFDSGFWNRFSAEEEKVLVRKEAMENYRFEYSEIERVMDEIQPFIVNIEEYLEAASRYREGDSGMDREEFTAYHSGIYSEMMKQSADIVKEFDNIYKSFVVGND